MSFVVTVRLVGRRDSEQPEPFILEPGAEWTTVELMLSSMYSEVSNAELDIRYWDDEDFVILSSQEELDEACRLASEKGILQIYVRSVDSADFTQPFSLLVQPSATSAADPVSGEEVPRERAPKRRADEAFTPERPGSGSAVDPSAPAVASPQTEDAAVDRVRYRNSSAAAAEASLAAQDGAHPAQNQEGGDAGASDQEHRMVPGAPSGANVIAIEMPECPLEHQEVGGGERQGTEAAEPAEMAETGEVAPKSGRDAETGFWMVPHGEKGETASTACASSSKRTQNDVRPKQPVPRSPAQAPKKVEGKEPSSAERSQKKKKQQSDALTQEIFYVHMAKVKSELRREIVKDVTRKTVRQVVEGVSRLQASRQHQAEAGGDLASLQESKAKWPVSLHERIICDNCDETILGPRFKCGNCTNYDLCEVCENIYPPVHDPIHVFLKLRKPCPKAGIRHGQRVALLKRTIYQPEVEDQMSREERRKEKADVDRLNRIAQRLKVKEAKVQEKLAKREEKLRRIEAKLEMEDPLNGSPYGELSAEFVKDETIPDGTIVSPGQQLEKSWVMRNNGTMTWPSTTVLELVQTNMSAKQTVEPVGPVQPGKETIITVHLIVPRRQGDYESHWRLNNKGQVFGHTVFCKVCVEDEASTPISIPAQPKLITPKCETPVVGFSQADGISLLLRANEELSESAEQAQEKEESREDREEVEAVGESLINFLHPVMMPQRLDQPALQAEDEAEASDPWAVNQSQAGPNLSTSGSGSGSGPSPAVPSTPNNTPFAVSPPSGRCVSPPPSWFEVMKPWTHKATSPSASLETSSDHAFMLLKKKFGPRDAASEEDAEESGTARQNCSNWMFGYLVEADSENDATDEAEEDSQPQNGSVENIGTVLTPQLVPSAPVEDTDVGDQAEAGSVDASKEGSQECHMPHLSLQREVKVEEDAESCPELLFCDDFVMCPPQKVVKEDSAPDVESVDEELYASATSPKPVGLGGWLEMPIVGPSPVMPNEDISSEVLRPELCREEAPDHRHSSREVSPGSTTSSVEVVSVADMKELEREEGEEEYRSIDTHGAWFFPAALGQPVSLDLEKDDGEGYELLPYDSSSPSDDSSSDDDFCIVMPDCFDTSKPLRCNTPTEERMERLSKNCVKEAVCQGKDGYAQFQDARESLDELPKSSDLSEQAKGDSQIEEEVSELTDGLRAEAKDLAEKSEATERSNLLAQREEEFVRIVTQALGLKASRGPTTDEEVEAEAEKSAEEACEKASAYMTEESPEEDQDSGTEETEYQDGTTELTERQDGRADDTEHGGADDTEHPDDRAEESEPLDGGAEETELKTGAEKGSEPDEEVAGAAAADATSTAVVHVVDPGQQLNQLVQNTVKAATSGLQHIFQTTKDVIKTLQAESQYEVKESKYEFKPSNFVLPKSTWQPSDKQYVPPRNDFQPPKSDYQLPKSTYTGPKSQLSGGVVYSGEFAAPLKRIREMGYFNNERTLALLKKHNGDVHLVVDELCMETDNEWCENRH